MKEKKPRQKTQLEQLIDRALKRTPTFVAPLFGAEEYTRHFLEELAEAAKKGRVLLPKFGVFYVLAYKRHAVAGKTAEGESVVGPPTRVLKFRASSHHRGMK